MFNKMLICFAAVLLGIMSLGFIQANTNDYTPVPRDANTRVAYIDQIYQDNGRTFMKVNFIDWYEGAEADRVFREREQDPEMTEAPDGYYIVNDDTELHTYEVVADAKVLMQIYSHIPNVAATETNWNEEISLDKLVSLFADDTNMSLKGFPYHLTIQNGLIVKIIQQYVP